MVSAVPWRATRTAKGQAHFRASTDRDDPATAELSGLERRWPGLSGERALPRGFRRPGLLADALLEEVLAVVGPDECVASLVGRQGASRPAPGVKAAVPRPRRLSTDLDRRLDGTSRP